MFFVHRAIFTQRAPLESPERPRLGEVCKFAVRSSPRRRYSSRRRVSLCFFFHRAIFAQSALLEAPDGPRGCTVAFDPDQTSSILVDKSQLGNSKLH